MLTDIIDKNLKVIFCGINPGLKSAWDGHHFSGRSNRFWKAIHLAGFTPYEIDPMQDFTFLNFGYGLTTAVARATTRADELSKEEFTASIESFKKKIIQYQPQYIAFLGKAAYKVLSGKKEISWGYQEEKFCGASVWILPNPSGLNRGFMLNDLVQYYSELYRAVS
ncbi:G/U mismatch-specific DNA glycosylase [Pedobacter sp. UBA5917]|jgi:TDG/mug DNA glycosylase family protein|uniref:G/U mismatch-specific DNA glycosylase n=1 Tax=Pedobacter sp. UBA5917 TaxID=1947061 RepID=UPI0025DF25FA|nr:G/U mismatch-specific DNA glycosylase [Pedobacter sp. UBA5917]